MEAVSDDLDIPEFLKRPVVKALAPVKSEVQMSDVSVETEAPATPAPRKPRKPAKAKGASKAAAGGKAAPAKVKAAGKPAKAKAKAAKPRESKTPKDQFGFRVGSIKSQAAAMYASKKGATLAEVKEKLDSVQLNLLTSLEEAGFKISKVKEDGPGNRQVTRYFLRAK